MFTLIPQIKRGNWSCLTVEHQYRYTLLRFQFDMATLHEYTSITAFPSVPRTPSRYRDICGCSIYDRQDITFCFRPVRRCEICNNVIRGFPVGTGGNYRYLQTKVFVRFLEAQRRNVGTLLWWICKCSGKWSVTKDLCFRGMKDIIWITWALYSNRSEFPEHLDI